MNRYSLRRISDCDTEPVTLAEAADHLRANAPQIAVDGALITRNIKSARHAIEQEIGRPIGLQIWELGLREWPMLFPMQFPRPPLALLQSIKYLCADGVNRVLFNPSATPPVPCTSFIVDPSGDPGELWLTQTGWWPVEQLANGFPVRLRFQCGLVDYDEDLKNAVLMTVAHIYENREPFAMVAGLSAVLELPMGVKDLCARYKYVVMG